jgi:hypothetical protein
MIKKMFATMLALSMCLSLAACGPKGSASTSGSSAGTSGSSASGSQAAASDVDYVKEKGTLVVGMTDFAPMDYKAEGSDEWIGFDAAQVEFEVQPRAAGSSKWSIRSLTRYAITNLASFSTAPLQLVTFLGVLVFLSSLVLGTHSLWQKLNGQALEGFTTVILLLLLIGSVLMICLGIIGYYIAKIYEEIKDRPRYIVADECGGLRDEE